MKVSLGLLSFGTLTTWLVAGPFSELLHNTLPFHEIHALPTTEILQEVLSLPTLIALNAVAIGLDAVVDAGLLEGAGQSGAGPGANGAR